MDILRLANSINIVKINQFCSAVAKTEEVFQTHMDEYKMFMLDGFKSDDQFALFCTAIEDFQAYLAVYIAIRTSDWTLRNAGIKSMATRFVRSGATLYQWLVLRHLADLGQTFPDSVITKFENGAWVRALKDGQGVTLARDEYHERTASKNIQLIMPKQLTKKNMEVLTQYATYGARSRENMLAEIFGKEKSGFELAKGCSRRWLCMQEQNILLFFNMLTNEKPFKIESRELRQPFTTTMAKKSVEKDFLGREAFGSERTDYGKELLISYIKPRFCNDVHSVDREKLPMQRKTLSLFPKTSKRKKA